MDRPSESRQCSHHQHQRQDLSLIFWLLLNVEEHAILTQLWVGQGVAMHSLGYTWRSSYSATATVLPFSTTVPRSVLTPCMDTMLVLKRAPDLLPSGRLCSKFGSMRNEISMPISEMFCHTMCRRSWRVRPPSASTARCQGQTSCGGALRMPHHTRLTSLTLCTTTMARTWTPARSPLTISRCGDPLANTATKDMNDPIYRCSQI